MNIIDAWKALQSGKNIQRPMNSMISDYWRHMSIHQFLDKLDSDSILADDWEVVKERKAFTTEVKIGSQFSGGIYIDGLANVPWNDIKDKTGKLTFEWEE